MITLNSSLNITGINFTNNNADDSNSALFKGIMFTIEGSTHISDSIFDYNSGSLYIFNSNLTFSGYTRFESCAEPLNNIATEDTILHQEGGAITSFQSTIIFTGVSSLLNNKARCGGAILATESRIVMYTCMVTQQ